MGVNVNGFDYSNNLNWKPNANPATEIPQKVKELGFNAVRLPIAFQTIDDGTGLANVKSFMTKCCEQKLLVLIDCHNIRHDEERYKQAPYFSVDKMGAPIQTRNGETVTTEKFASLWIDLISKLKEFPNFYGVDLFNEPHDQSDKNIKLTWGDSGAYDWHRDASIVGKKILEKHPDMIIYVEGTSSYNTEVGQWGGMLMGAKDKPITDIPCNKLMYAPTAYGPDLYGHEYAIKKGGSGWEKDTHVGALMTAYHAPNFPSNMPDIWTKHWGFIHDGGIGAVTIKEWGGHMGTWADLHLKTIQGLYGGATEDKIRAESMLDAKWTAEFVKYCKDRNLDMFYWALYANTEDHVGGIMHSGGNFTAKDGNGTALDKMTIIKSAYGSTPQQILTSCP